MADKIKDLTIKLEGRINGHEALCAERYANIERRLDTINKKINKHDLPKLVVIMSIILGLFLTITKFIG